MSTEWNSRRTSFIEADSHANFASSPMLVKKAEEGHFTNQLELNGKGAS
jgi:hypothetical protein